MSHETLLTYFYKNVKECPDRVALRHKDYGIWHDVTWKQYGEKVRQVAMGLISASPSSAKTVRNGSMPTSESCRQAE